MDLQIVDKHTLYKYVQLFFPDMNGLSKLLIWDIVEEHIIDLHPLVSEMTFELEILDEIETFQVYFCFLMDTDSSLIALVVFLLAIQIDLHQHHHCLNIAEYPLDLQELRMVTLLKTFK